MVQTINPLTASPQVSQARLLGLKEGQIEAGMQNEVANNLVAGMGKIQDYHDDKYLLEILAKGGLDNQEAADQFATDFQGVTPQNIGQIAANRAQNLQAQGIDASDTLELAQMGQIAPQNAMTAVNNLNAIIQDPRVRNYLARNPTRATQTLQNFGPKDTNAQMTDYMKMRMEEDADVRKELRGDLRKRVGDIDKNINTLEANYTKLQNLADKMRSGNRSSIAQGLVALVKLNDPNSAVLNSEMEAALNNQNPVSAIAKYLVGKGVSEDVTTSIVAKLDPLSPDAVNVDDILATADAMISANVGSLQSSYSEARTLGENLGATGIKSIFTDAREKRLEKLSNIGKEFPNAPKIGAEQDGYRYKGGNPSSPSSWEQI